MLSLLVNLLKALNSDNSARQIALAVCLGFIVGLTPFLSIHNLIIILCVFMLKVHFGSFILAWGLFSGVGYLVQGGSIALGEYLLTLDSLQGMFASLYQFTWFKLAHLHHTYTLGALMLSALCAFPLYFITLNLVNRYRIHIQNFIEKLWIVRVLKASKFYRWYSQTLSQDSL